MWIRLKAEYPDTLVYLMDSMATNLRPENLDQQRHTREDPSDLFSERVIQKRADVEVKIGTSRPSCISRTSSSHLVE